MNEHRKPSRCANYRGFGYQACTRALLVTSPPQHRMRIAGAVRALAGVRSNPG
jgi:hypothetical protein